MLTLLPFLTPSSILSVDLSRMKPIPVSIAKKSPRLAANGMSQKASQLLTPAPSSSKVVSNSTSGGGVVTTVVQVAPPSTSSNNNAHATGTTTTTIEMPADTLQLMGMASSLPTSNLFVNYPHTMWEKDAEGNRIVVKTESNGESDLLQPNQVSIKQEEAGGSASTSTSSLGPTIVVQRPQNAQKNSEQPRPHVCDVCQKGFVKREHLTKHLRIHKNDNKRYSCEYCQKAFRDRYELVRHTRRHTGDFPFR